MPEDEPEEPAEHAEHAEEPDGAHAGDPEGLAALSGAMRDVADEPETPRRRAGWLRYPGFVGALLVVAVLIVVPCGIGGMYLTGAFADPGKYESVPDACTLMDTGQLGQKMRVPMAVKDQSRDTSTSICEYQIDQIRAKPGTGAANVMLALTRYDTKGPLSAARMAHAGMYDATASDNEDLPDGMASPATQRQKLSGVGEEAVVVSGSGNEVTVYARVSNVMLRLRADTSYIAAPELGTDLSALANQVLTRMR